MTDSIVVPCAHCATLNRIPNQKRAEQPQCGSCKKPIFVDSAFDLDAATFSKQSKGDVPLLVDVWASWCGPCRQIAPVLEELAKEYEGQVRVVKVDVQEHPEVAAKFGIRSIPTLKTFKAGQEVGSQVGAAGKQQLASLIEQAL